MICYAVGVLANHDARAKDQIQIAGDESHAIEDNGNDVSSTRENAMTEGN